MTDKKYLSIDGPDGTVIVAFYKGSKGKKRRRPIYNVTLFSCADTVNGKTLIFNGYIGYLRARTLRRACRSGHQETAYNWLTRIALDSKAGRKAFDEFLHGEDGKTLMAGAGYLADCIKYKHFTLVPGGAPS